MKRGREAVEASLRAPLRAVLFDLDGTLVDSAPDIAAAINELMATCGLNPHSLATVRGMIGNGIEKLVERAFAAHGMALAPRDFRDRNEQMTDIYSRNLTRLTTLRPGAGRALSAAREAGMRVAVVTNKPEGFSRAILSRFGLLSEIAAVIGGDSGHPKKPAPDMLLAACEGCGCSVDQAVLVGDSATDAAAAKAAGMPCIILRGGYTDVPPERFGADRIIEGFDELGSILVAAGEIA